MAREARRVEAENLKDVLDIYADEHGHQLTMKDLKNIFRNTEPIND